MQSVLALCFHPAFTPPKSGGEERLFYVLNGLSKKIPVTLISFTHPKNDNVVETVRHSENFTEVRIPKTWISSRLHDFIGRCTSITECSAVITSIESRFNKNFKKILEEELKKSDIILYESPFLYTSPDRYLQGKKIVYNAYNNEYDLMKPAFSHSIVGRFFLKYVFDIEKKLAGKSDVIFVVSADDKNSLVRTYHTDPKKIFLAPNGIPVAEYDTVFSQRAGCRDPPVCLFIGSYHPPNIEAVNEILKMSAVLPELVFVVAGNVAQYFTSQDGLTVMCGADEISFFQKARDIRLTDGFHSLELWDTTPVIWTKPVSKISTAENVESVSITFFSPHVQAIRISGNSLNMEFSACTGWNTLEITIPPGETTLIFTCEKELRDSKRVLGVALRSIGYSKNKETKLFDFNESSNQISRFTGAKNVYLLGQISDAEKKEIFRIADIALTPMVSGSGTNIKVLGYLSAGIPTVTTSHGARGLNLIDHKHVLICDLKDFPGKIQELLSDDRLSESLKKNGRYLVEEKYDWDSIVHGMSEKMMRMDL